MKKARARNVRPQAVQQPGRHAGQVHRGDLGHQGGAGGAGQIIIFLFREIGTKICEIRFRTQDCCPKCSGKVFEAEKMVTAAVSSNVQYFLWQSELF